MLLKLTQNIAKIYKLLVNQLEENIWRHIGCLVKIEQCSSNLQNTHAFACIQNIAKIKKTPCKSTWRKHMAPHRMFSQDSISFIFHVSMCINIKHTINLISVTLYMSNFNGHLLFQTDRLSCSYLNPPGGTNFTLPVLILTLSGRRSNHSYGRFIH